jgi:arylsulfatase A-like enzyme
MKLIKFSTALLSVFFIGSISLLSAQDKPNILFIMTDELSAESMSFNLGTKYINTPNIDQLAKNGVVFKNAYCANPLCVPSRSSIFTGRYPHEVGIQSNDEKKLDPATFPSLGSIFKKAGYETGYVGKWHLPYERKAQATHGFDYLPNKTGNGDDSTSPILASNFLKTKRDHPFLLVVSFMNPHNICQWARGEKLPDGAIGNAPPADQCPPLRPNAKPSANETDIMKFMRFSIQNNDAFPVGTFSEDKWRQYIWSYYRLIEKVDAEIGKVLKALKESGKDKNTIIVFTSDHGDMQGAHLWNQKTVFYEEAAKVPFIISYNGVKPRISSYLVQSGTDILPTLSDFAGIPVPTRYPGNSLKQYLEKDMPPAKREYVVVSDHIIQGVGVDGEDLKPEGRMIRNGQYKYWIYDLGKERETLFDLKNDPGEMINLAQDPKHKTALQKCRQQLMAWAIKNNDPFQKHLIK